MLLIAHAPCIKHKYSKKEPSWPTALQRNQQNWYLTSVTQLRFFSSSTPPPHHHPGRLRTSLMCSFTFWEKPVSVSLFHNSPRLTVRTRMSCSSLSWSTMSPIPSPCRKKLCPSVREWVLVFLTALLFLIPDFQHYKKSSKTVLRLACKHIAV